MGAAVRSAAGAVKGRAAAVSGSKRRRGSSTVAILATGLAPALLLLLLLLLPSATRGAQAAFSLSSSVAGARSLVTATDPHAEEALIGWKGETWQPGLDADAAGGDGGGKPSSSAGDGADEPTRHPQLSEFKGPADDASVGSAPHARANDLHADKADGGASSVGGANAAAAAAEDADDKEKWVELLSWRPRAFLYHNFLSAAEAEHIVHLTEGKVQRSGVVDAKTGKTKLDPIRTSTGAALSRGHDGTVADIERRVSEWTRLPASHAEAIQVLRYENGQTYKAHWDWFDDPLHLKEAEAVGNRVATVLFYLSDVEEGGATTLPLASPANTTRARAAFAPLDPSVDPSADPQCAGVEGGGMGMAVRPRKGDALLFWDMLPDGKTVDRRALHASCPTLRGVKYTATLWVHSKRYGAPYEPLLKSGRCEDADRRCEGWAREAPESRCDAEAGRMLGLRGLCRRACRDCEACAADDVLCLRANARSRRRELLARDEERRRRKEEEGVVDEA